MGSGSTFSNEATDRDVIGDLSLYIDFDLEEVADRPTRADDGRLSPSFSKEAVFISRDTDDDRCIF